MRDWDYLTLAAKDCELLSIASRLYSLKECTVYNQQLGLTPLLLHQKKSVCTVVSWSKSPFRIALAIEQHYR